MAFTQGCLFPVVLFIVLYRAQVRALTSKFDLSNDHSWAAIIVSGWPAMMHMAQQVDGSF